jgi:L-asparaginase/archaeal Glu-tRNAGln amidotransferase subunit D
MTQRKRIALLSTGGTIASAPGTEGRAIAGALPGEQLLASTQLEGVIDVHVESVFQKASNSIAAPEWAHLAKRCRMLAEKGDIDGIVITHGTDTLEDTAYYLHSTLDTQSVPVVVTGSQRTPHAMGSDAFSNLRQALELAANDKARSLGVLVSFNQSVYSAGFVRKVSSYQLNGFDAPGLGPVGLLDNGEFHLLQWPARQALLPVPDQLVRVDILPVYGGADRSTAESLVRSGCQGLVIDGLGRGQVPPSWVSVIENAIQDGLVVAVCSSTLHGAVHESYDYPGALHDLVLAGAVSVSHVSARKARIRLALSLSAFGAQLDAIRSAFEWRSPFP